MQIIGPVTVYKNANKTVLGVFDTLGDMVIAYKWDISRFTVNINKVEPFTKRWHNLTRHLNYNETIDQWALYATDSSGLVISKEVIKEAWLLLPNELFRHYRYYTYYKCTKFSHNYHNRIPKKEKRLKIGRAKPNFHKQGGSWMYRNIRTQAERRIACAHEQEGIKVRGKRNYVNIPNSYDDVSKGSWGHDSWKRFRKTQYKVK
jgi:hypothetical protein